MDDALLADLRTQFPFDIVRDIYLQTERDLRQTESILNQLLTPHNKQWRPSTAQHPDGANRSGGRSAKNTAHTRDKLTRNIAHSRNTTNTTDSRNTTNATDSRNTTNATDSRNSTNATDSRNSTNATDSRNAMDPIDRPRRTVGGMSLGGKAQAGSLLHRSVCSSRAEDTGLTKSLAPDVEEREDDNATLEQRKGSTDIGITEEEDLRPSEFRVGSSTVKEIICQLDKYELNYPEEFIIYFLQHYSKLDPRSTRINAEQRVSEILLTACASINGLESLFEQWRNGEGKRIGDDSVHSPIGESILLPIGQEIGEPIRELIGGKSTIEKSIEGMIERSAQGMIEETVEEEDSSEDKSSNSSNSCQEGHPTLPFIQSLYAGVIDESVVQHLWNSLDGDAEMVISAVEDRMEDEAVECVENEVLDDLMQDEDLIQYEGPLTIDDRMKEGIEVMRNEIDIDLETVENDLENELEEEDKAVKYESSLSSNDGSLSSNRNEKWKKTRKMIQQPHAFPGSEFPTIEDAATEIIQSKDAVKASRSPYDAIKEYPRIKQPMTRGTNCWSNTDSASFLTLIKSEHLAWSFPTVDLAEVEFTFAACANNLESAARLLLEEHLSRLRPSLVQDAEKRLERRPSRSEWCDGINGIRTIAALSPSGALSPTGPPGDGPPSQRMRSQANEVSDLEIARRQKLLSEYVKYLLGYAPETLDQFGTRLAEDQFVFRVFRGRLLDWVCNQLEIVYPELAIGSVKDIINSHQRVLREEDNLMHRTSLPGIERMSEEDREIFTPFQLRSPADLEDILKFSKRFVEVLIWLGVKSIQEVFGIRPRMPVTWYGSPIRKKDPLERRRDNIRKMNAYVAAIVGSFKTRMTEGGTPSLSRPAICRPIIRGSLLKNDGHHHVRNPPDSSIPFEDTPRRHAGIAATAKRQEQCELFRAAYYSLLQQRNICLRNLGSASAAGDVVSSAVFQSQSKTLHRSAQSAKSFAANQIFSLFNPDLPNITPGRRISESIVMQQRATTNRRAGGRDSGPASEPFALVDLHGLLIDEALEIVPRQLKYYRERAAHFKLVYGGPSAHVKDELRPFTVHVVTGRGLHSRRTGISRLREAVQKYLESQVEFRWRFGPSLSEIEIGRKASDND